MISLTARGEYSAAANIGANGTFATSAFTPAADSVLIAFVSTQGPPTGGGQPSTGIASLAGHGTWERLDAGGAAGNDQLLEVWACKTPATPTSAAVTATNKGDQTKIRAALSVIEATGDDLSGDLADIIRQIVEVNQSTASTSGGATLATFAAGSATLIGVSSNNWIHPASFESPLTGIHSLPTNTELMRLETAGYAGEDLTPAFTFPTAYTFRVVALEVADGAGGPAPVEDLTASRPVTVTASATLTPVAATVEAVSSSRPVTVSPAGALTPVAATVPAVTASTSLTVTPAGRLADIGAPAIVTGSRPVTVTASATLTPVAATVPAVTSSRTIAAGGAGLAETPPATVEAVSSFVSVAVDASPAVSVPGSTVDTLRASQSLHIGRNGTLGPVTPDTPKLSATAALAVSVSGRLRAIGLESLEARVLVTFTASGRGEFAADPSWVAPRVADPGIAPPVIV